MVGRRISHYHIVEKLGEGAMGVVYKAEDSRLGRSAALKFLGPHLAHDEEARRRFVREARAAASLNHPNICTIYGFSEENDTAFIAMEFVEGRPLAAALENGPLEIETAVRIGIQIAIGLGEAHEKGLIHRDIKPQNIMLAPQGRVKIMDFGLALLARDSAQTRQGDRHAALHVAGAGAGRVRRSPLRPVVSGCGPL